MSISPILVINQTVVNAVSTAANITSSVIDISDISGYAVHLFWTGSTDGVIKVEGSNEGLLGTNFVMINSVNTGASAGSAMLQEDIANFTFIRVTYTRTAGSGLLSAIVSGKR
jgi:hypothetical protein